MFLCRAGRLSAGALGRTFKGPGSFQLLRVDAPGPGTARTGLSFQRRRLWHASAGGVEPHRAHLGGQKAADRVQNRDAWSCGFVSAESGHWDRAAAGRVRRRAGEFDNIRRHDNNNNSSSSSSSSSSRGDTGWVVLFTGDRGAAGTRRRFTSTVMQLRASSTSAAARKSDEQARGDKVEASTRSTPEKRLEDTPEPTSEPTSEPTPEPTPEPGEGKPNKTQQLKKVFKEYGAVGVSFHISISLMSLGMFYLLISSGIDMTAMLCKLGFSEAVVRSKMAAGTSTFVLAYAIHKLFAPVRISITLVSVPLIVRYFRKTGLFKPPTPAP